MAKNKLNMARREANQKFFISPKLENTKHVMLILIFLDKTPNNNDPNVVPCGTPIYLFSVILYHKIVKLEIFFKNE